MPQGVEGGREEGGSAVGDLGGDAADVVEVAGVQGVFRRSGRCGRGRGGMTGEKVGDRGAERRRSVAVGPGRSAWRAGEVEVNRESEKREMEP